jgi:hypothetical protein
MLPFKFTSLRMLIELVVACTGLGTVRLRVTTCAGLGIRLGMGFIFIG